MSQSDVRWIQRFDNFKRAFARLAQANALAGERELSELEKQGLIHTFESTHELAWSTWKGFLETRGATAIMHGPRETTREAFVAGLTDHGDMWMRMIEHRHQTSRAYDQRVAHTIAEAILTGYVAEFADFQGRMIELEREETQLSSASRIVGPVQDLGL